MKYAEGVSCYLCVVCLLMVYNARKPWFSPHSSSAGFQVLSQLRAFRDYVFDLQSFILSLPKRMNETIYSAVHNLTSARQQQSTFASHIS